LKSTGGLLSARVGRSDGSSGRPECSSSEDEHYDESR
jgi:hypothetical protein